MSTTNGFGTLYYDWEVGPDETVEATEWFVMQFFPVLPLGRYRLSVHTSGIKPSFFSLGLNKQPFELSCEKLGRVRITALRLLKTYVMGFIVTPLILISPLLITLIVIKTTQPLAAPGQQPVPALPQSALPWVILFQFVWWGLVVSWILDRTSGRHLASRDE